MGKIFTANELTDDVTMAISPDGSTTTFAGTATIQVLQEVFGGGGGGGGITSIQEGTGVEVDDTVLASPVVGLNSASILSLSKANSAVQPEELIDYAPLDSPALTGEPTTPTPEVGDNSIQVANTAFIVALLASLDSDDIIQGLLNLYATDENVDDSIAILETGTSFPASPYMGQRFFRTDLGENFYADTVRGYWLGELRQDRSGSTNAAATGNLGRENGTTGIPLFSDFLIVGVAAQAIADFTGNIEVKNGASIIATLTFEGQTENSDYTLAVEIPAGGRLTTSVSAAINKPIVLVDYKRRYDIT